MIVEVVSVLSSSGETADVVSVILTICTFSGGFEFLRSWSSMKVNIFVLSCVTEHLVVGATQIQCM